MSFNFNIKCDLFALLKKIYIKLILYKFHFFIIKRIDINNVFLNDKKMIRFRFRFRLNLFFIIFCERDY